jgi:hypothetical protein
MRYPSNNELFAMGPLKKQLQAAGYNEQASEDGTMTNRVLVTDNT